jgi:hypothetical protein
MTTKKRWTWIGAFALFTLCVYLFPFFIHSPSSLKDVDRVRQGMTVTEVEAILGKSDFRLDDPPNSTPGYTLTYQLADGWAGIAYNGDDRVKLVVWAREQSRFWQSIKWLRHR